MNDMRLRQVTLGGQSWRLAGWAEDSFFRYAGHHRQGMEQLGSVAAAVMPQPGVALDVGANFGLSVLVLAPLCRRLVAVEASPRTAAALRGTIAANGLETKVTVEAVALGAAPGELAFHHAEHSAGSHFVTAETLGGEALATQPVPVQTLDSLVERHALDRLDFIKIDVEGHETEVLDGAAATLARFRPAVCVEFNAWVLQCTRRANPRAVLEDWLARFPVAHALRGSAPPFRITQETLLAFLHDHLVKRGCADDLVLGYDESWVKRWKPPG